MEELNQRVASAIREQLAGAPSAVTGAGIGSAGPINELKGTINPVNISEWVDFSLVDFVKSVSGISDVRLIGDASALAYAEFCVGAGQNATNLLGVVVSTGVVVIDGDQCACGARGCVEAYASGTNMSRNAGMERFEDVAAAARAGNQQAIAVIDQGAKVLATALVNAVATMDLDTIVVGGGVINAADVYWRPLQHHFETQLQFLNFPSTVSLVRSTLGKNSGLIGAGLVGFISVDQREGAL
jgi:glucokinase